MAISTPDAAVTKARVGTLERADWCAAGVIAAAAVFLLVPGIWVFLRGDDWILLSLVSAPDYGVGDLFVPYSNHLTPFGLAMIRFAVTVGGPSPWWLLVAMAAGFVLVGLVFTWLIIRSLVGPRLAAVVPLAFVAWSPSLLAVVMWPASKVDSAPVFAAGAGALWAYLTHRHRWVVGFVTFGFFVSELTLLGVAALAVVSVVWMRRTVRDVWRQERRLWTALLIVVGVYVVAYLFLSSRVAALDGNQTRAGTVIEGVVMVLGVALPDVIVHGPWRWTNTPGPLINQPLALGVAIALVAWVVILRARRAGWRAWVPAAVQLVLLVAVLSGARLRSFGPVAMLNPYYFVSVLVLLAATLAVGYLPSRLPIDDPQRAEPRRFWWALAGAVLLVSSCVSAVAYVRAVPAMPSREFLASAREALQEPTLNTSSPRQAFGVFAYSSPWDTAENTFRTVGVPGDWQRSSHDPFMVGDTGQRVPLTVDGIPFELSGPCVPVGEEQAFTAPINRDPSWPTYVMTYVAAADTVATVTIGEEELRIPLVAGGHSVYFTGDGTPEQIVVRADGVCVSGLRMGQPRAL